MFVVRFVRMDDFPNEEYYYNSYTDALKHFNMFMDDCCGLYMIIELQDAETLNIMARNILPGISDEQAKALGKYIQPEQYETCVYLTHVAERSPESEALMLINLRLRLAYLTPEKFKYLAYVISHG